MTTTIQEIKDKLDICYEFSEWKVDANYNALWTPRATGQGIATLRMSRDSSPSDTPTEAATKVNYLLTNGRLTLTLIGFSGENIEL